MQIEEITCLLLLRIHAVISMFQTCKKKQKQKKPHKNINYFNLNTFANNTKSAN